MVAVAPDAPSVTLGESTWSSGGLSSSVIASAAPVTAPTPRPLAAVAVTVADRSASSRRLSTAAIVAVSEALAVRPAGMTMAASEATRAAPPAGTCTVTVVGSAEGCESVADTAEAVVAP